MTATGPRIRIDLPRENLAGPPPVTYAHTMMAKELDWPDAVLHECSDCNRVHLVALECPTPLAETRPFVYSGKTYQRVVESVK